MQNQTKRSLIKKFIIYPKFQMKLLSFNLAIVLIGFGCISYRIWSSFHDLEKIGTNANLPADHIFFKFLDHQLHELFFPDLLITFLIVIVFTSLVTLRLSQKLAGPILRMKTYFESIEKNPGEAKHQLKFREGDFFDDLPEVINKAHSRLK
ncbi:MAG: hypothetical protein JNM93_01425 [Bacteriovoracaceae bacterium]|nr:hypothetical protein [Bacteriovoracaceae bacterium]